MATVEMAATEMAGMAGMARLEMAADLEGSL
jgi:hypothetical protein